MDKLDKTFETLIAAAIRAPSGDNTQPWRFVIDPVSRWIAIELDETRDPTPMNSGQRMARLAIGAALENMLRQAACLGWTAEVVEPPASALAAARIVKADNVSESLELDPMIVKRSTNRRTYSSEPVSDRMLEALRYATQDCEGVRTVWIHERDRLDSLAQLIGRSDALMFREASMRYGFLDNIRFDIPWRTAADEGMSLGCLQLSAADRMAVRMLRFVPNWAFKLFGVSRTFAATARRLVASASGMCIVTENAGTEATEIVAGRVMQRAWLKLTELGLATQPMMSLAILENVLVRGSEPLQESLGRRQAESILAELRRLVPEVGQDNLAFVTRFGYAEAPTCGTERLPPEANCRILGGSRSIEDK